MTTNDDQYVPDEMDARGCFLDGAAGAFVREDWEAFLARVRRDAAREALDGLADNMDSIANGAPDLTTRHAAMITSSMTVEYKKTVYPEETP